jgi:anti-anti-sigma regulatory factor
MATNFLKDKLASTPMSNYVAVARGRDLVVIRVIGRGNMLNAPALQEFAEEQRKAGYTQFLFDFERCGGLDSTFMGVMVGMQSAGDSGRYAAVSVPALVKADQPKNTGSPDETAELMPMSPEEALAALANEGIGYKRQPSPPASVSVVNASKEIQALLAMLGVDKFVNMRGTCDVSKLETTILPEKAISPLERQELIFKAHEQLVEIDRRNEAHFGEFRRSLAEELGRK